MTTLIPGRWMQCGVLVAVMASCVAFAQEGKKPLSTFNEAYFSQAKGRKQSFQVVLPPGYSPKGKYPMMVQMFGSANLLPTRKRPFIRVRPNGRGVWGFRSMSRSGVLQVIGHMKKTYPIDENRIYITGTSAGATVALRQDVFAGVVPLVAFGNDLPLENFRNLPIRCEHGVNDWTSAIGNVRVQFQKLKKLGYDAVLNEHPTAGHGIRVPPPKTMDWLFSLKRNPSPKHIAHSVEQAATAVDAGARFVVTPGFNPRTVTWCQENKVPVFPGIATPTDLELALEHGVETVKFFPAETLGGVNTLKAFSGPYGEVQFIPTGGIHTGNLADYLALSSVLACGGSWMVKPGDWAETTRLTAEAMELINE